MKRILFLIFVLIISAACQQKQQQTTAQGPVEGQLQDQGEIRMLEEAVRNDPGNVNAWIKMGNIYMDSNRASEAVGAYQKALDIDPKNVDVRVDMGSCLRNLGKPDLAIGEFRKAIGINPSHLNAHKNLAIVFAYDLNNPKEAIKEFERALELAPNAPDAGRIKVEIDNLRKRNG